MSVRPSIPPRLADRFLNAFCRPELAEEIRGDLVEAWEEDLDEKGRFRANLIYWLEVILFIRSHVIRRRDPSRARGSVMWGNYTKVALRSMKRDKLQSSITVVSLSVGIAAGVLILLFARHELTSDSFHESVEDVYRIHRVEQRTRGGERASAGVSMPLAPELETTFGNVEAATRVRPGTVQLISQGSLFDQDVLHVDPVFFDVFSFPMATLGGDSSFLPLASQTGVVLTRNLADRLFEGDFALGEMLEVRISGRLEILQVEAIVESVPANSSIQFEMLLPIRMWPSYDAQVDQWVNFNVATFVRLRPGEERQSFQSDLDRFTSVRFAEAMDMFITSGWWQDREDAFELLAMPLQEVHFSTDVRPMVVETASASGLRILLAIGLAVLLLACMNFMTLAVGRSTARAAEVGVRKTFGARRSQLISQFWGEAQVMGLLSLGVSVVLVLLLLAPFNALAGTGISLTTLDATLVGQVLMLTVIAGLVAGAYPALVLSRFKPSNVLKGQSIGRVGRLFSRSMVVVQFAVSIAMIAGTFIIMRQVDYVKSADLGFAGDEVILVDLQADQVDVDTMLPRFEEALERQSDVVRVAASSFGMIGGGMRQVIEHEGNQLIVATTRVDEDYLEAMDIALVSGRNLSGERETDIEQAVLINQAFAEELGFEDPVGRMLPGYESAGVQIVGVIEDFHYESLHTPIGPMILHMSPTFSSHNYALVRIQPASLSAAMQTIESVWNELMPNQPFVANYLDQRLDQMYQDEERWGQIMRYAAFIAIVLACLGLFGLASLTVRQRRREIGIRKVLGASGAGVSILVSREFLVLVLIALVLAVGPTWLLAERWLQGFAYHTTVSADVFVITCGLAMTIAVLVVGGQTWKAAQTNPVTVLRSNQ